MSEPQRYGPGDPQITLKSVEPEPKTIDERMIEHIRSFTMEEKRAWKALALYWEMKAEFAEDLGFYLGRLKELEREVEHLHRVCVERSDRGE